MSTAKPRPLRLASGAVLIPVMRIQEWHDRAILAPGLTDLDWKVLAAICAWYRWLYVEEFAGSLSYQRIAQRLDTDAVNVRWAVDRLVGLGLIALKPGAGGGANTYLPALPRRVAASMLSAVAAEVPAPPF